MKVSLSVFRKKYSGVQLLGCIIIACLIFKETAVWVAIPLYIQAAARSLQLCLTLCNPIDGSPPGFSVPGILKARTLEWVAISFSSAWKWKVKVKSLSCVWLLVTPWTAAYQAPPSMGFSRQAYWSVLPLPSPNSNVGMRNPILLHLCQHLVLSLFYFRSVVISHYGFNALP